MTNATTFVAYRKSNCRMGLMPVPVRSVKLLGQSEDGSLDLRITQGLSATFYRYSPIGVGWTADKWSADQERVEETYVINRASNRCTCPDGERRASKGASEPCKHIAALSAVLCRMEGGDR